MNQSFPSLAARDSSLEVFCRDAERIVYRAWRAGAGNERTRVLAVVPAAEQPSPAVLDRLAHEYGLRVELDRAWSARPIELLRESGRTVLLLDDPGGEPLDQLLGASMELSRFLRLAIAIAAAVGKVHQHGLVHKDIKPANILVNPASGQAWITGFGIASRLPRERQAPEPPETVAGTLAYMAPEQTGRMNRSIDSRSDLYALGVTLYEMLTGSLPFSASEAMEWVHCHIARGPVPPTEQLTGAPGAVSAIIMKLLAKTAEERYQTAAGLERDLRRCLAEWEARGRIDDFSPGEHDTPDRLLVPEKLYGRAREVDTLLAAFDRVVAGGAAELVLVSGYSGIGKSSVVNELHKVLVPPRGLFASGKFDQYKRDIPYSTLAQAFQNLIRALLGKSDAELAGWRDALREALGPNGRLIAELVPELQLVIGEQPPVPELPPQQAQGRFQLVFQRFLGVFARPEHPLALFLDDLQWLDAATLDLLEHLLTRSDLRHLLLIGAYRDNEVDAAHPLTRKLEAIRQAGAAVGEITLAPLAGGDLTQLIADTLRCEPEHGVPLAQLVHAKTAGNPFFAIRFLYTLAEEGLLAFDYDAARWIWDLRHIHAKGYTDNVVDLMVGKLIRLPGETQNALQQLACLGNAAEITTLSIILGIAEEQVHAALREAVRQELLDGLAGGYRFVHDRVQEAAYSLIAEPSRATAHLRIGRLLLARTAPERRDEAVFEVVNQLNRGAALMTSQHEREQLAELNLTAGRRAKASSAYAAALNYFSAGARLLGEDCWERRYELVFSLELLRAECEFLTGALAEAEQRLAGLSTRTADTVDQAAVACLRADLYTTLDQSSRAIAVGLDYLRQVGIDWSPHPTEEEAAREFERIWSQLGGRMIEDLIELPLMSDPAPLAILNVLTKLGPPALFTDSNLFSLVICRAVNLSIERGNCDGSCFAYVRLGALAGPRFDDYQAGFRFGRLGYELVEQRGLKRFQAMTYLPFGSNVIPWTKPLKDGRDLVRRAFNVASENGDLTYKSYCCFHLNTNLLAAGDPLVEVQCEAENGLAFAEKARFGFVIDIITAQLGLIRTLRGLTASFGSFDDVHFDERRIECRFSENPDLAFAEGWYWICKLQARFLAGDHASAVAAASRVQLLLWNLVSQFQTAEYHFYGALAHAACYDAAPAGKRRQHLDAVTAHHKQLQLWEKHCPENFENRAALIGAEIARIEGRLLDAERLYQQAILSAQTNGFVQNEAIAYECASAFYRARGFNQFADLYLRNARYSYMRWGADGKVRQLDQLYRHLTTEEPKSTPTSTIGAPVEHLDLATVIKVSQAVSGEMVLQKLIDSLMRTAIEHAGAERGLLILPDGTGERVAAEASTAGEAVDVRVEEQPLAGTALPESIVHYVVRTREHVILDDASAENPFAADADIRRRHVRSVLCLPLINQNKLAGVLYLENNLAPGVFTRARIAVLQLLASQAAISVENSRLYSEVRARETQFRRLVDCNIIGIIINKSDGYVREANDACLDMLGYSRDELLSGRMRWSELTPPEWQPTTARAWAELKETGIARPFEKEYFRKDGSRIPVLIGGAALDESANESVGFVLDLTKRKQVEQALRDSEEQWRAVFEHNPTMYFMIDAAGTIVSVNPFGAKQLGYTVAELVGHPVVKLFHEADRAVVTENAAICFQQPGRTMSWELRKLRKDGTVIWVRETARAMPIRQRSVLLIVCEDISERKQVQHLTQQWFESSPSGLAIIGRDYRYQRVNPVTARRWGIPAERMVGTHVAELRGWEEFEQVIKPRLDRCFTGDEQERRYTGWINLPTGRRYIMTTYTPLRPRSEQVEAALVIGNDITDYEIAAEALREAQAELAHMNRVTTMGQLTAAIAHEVNQPIAAAVTNAQAALRWLRARPPDLNEVRGALVRIVADGSRAGDVISRIRALIKKAPARLEPIDINETISEVVGLTRSEMLRNGVVLYTRLATNLPSVRGDRVQLGQVILNFVVNAIEAMKGMSERSRELLVVSDGNASAGVLVSVRDSGPGLSQESQERLFEPFYTTKPGGMGMGLSICRSIIQAHGGRVWASANLPRGAAFQFTLPARPPPESPELEPLD